MFDFENPFMEAVQKAEEETFTSCEPAAKTNWNDAEWDEVYNRPSRNVTADHYAAEYSQMKAEHDKEKQSLFENFHAKAYHRRKDRTMVKALRYTVAAIGCGFLDYFCRTYDISWLTWLLGFASAGAAMIASYGFGIVREMSR